MKQHLRVAAMMVMGAACTASMAAGNASATISVDNQFWLYTGNATGSDLQLVGSGANWQSPTTLNFDVNPGDYLYVLAQDLGAPHSFQGAFTTPLGPLYTNAASWVAAPETSPTVDSSVITSATWGSIGSDLPATSGPWGNVVGNTDAHWIWSSGPNSGDLIVLFRSADVVTAVPEPSSQGLLLAGGVLVAAALRRRHRAGPVAG